MAIKNKNNTLPTVEALKNVPVEPDSVIDINNLIVHYEMDEGIVEAVNNVNLHLKRGETLGIIGETGAGKTTIALSILGLLPAPRSHVVDGSIKLCGEELLTKSNKEMLHVRGKRISMIFQDPMTALNPVHTVGEQIAEVIGAHPDPEDTRTPTEQACDMLRVVGIPPERYNNYPFEFSGGMKQRVVIAMALACKPEIIIADEPTTALDVTIQAQVLDLMKNLREEYNTSILLITHDFGVVAEICDHCAVMYAGEIVESGTVEDIFDDPRHPYTKGLFDSLPRVDGESAVLKPINGLMPDPMSLPNHCTFADRCERCSAHCKEADPTTVEVTPGHFVKCFLCGSQDKEG